MSQVKKQQRTYQEMHEALQSLLQEMQREDLDIDGALKNYENGLHLVQEIRQYLKAAENKITELKVQFADQ